MRILLVALALAGAFVPLHGQTTSSRGFYYSWGYTRAAYSKSSIHFQNHSGAYNPVTGRVDNYDFVVHDAVAHDRPDFDKIKDVVNLTVPQYVFRIGFRKNKKWGFEL